MPPASQKSVDLFDASQENVVVVEDSSVGLDDIQQSSTSQSSIQQSDTNAQDSSSSFGISSHHESQMSSPKQPLEIELESSSASLTNPKAIKSDDDSGETSHNIVENDEELSSKLGIVDRNSNSSEISVSDLEKFSIQSFSSELTNAKNSQNEHLQHHTPPQTPQKSQKTPSKAKTKAKKPKLSNDKLNSNAKLKNIVPGGLASKAHEILQRISSNKTIKRHNSSLEKNVRSNSSSSISKMSTLKVEEIQFCATKWLMKCTEKRSKKLLVLCVKKFDELKKPEEILEKFNNNFQVQLKPKLSLGKIFDVEVFLASEDLFSF